MQRNPDIIVVFIQTFEDKEAVGWTSCSEHNFVSVGLRRLGQIFALLTVCVCVCVCARACVLCAVCVGVWGGVLGSVVQASLQP